MSSQIAPLARPLPLFLALLLAAVSLVPVRGARAQEGEPDAAGADESLPVPTENDQPPPAPAEASAPPQKVPDQAAFHAALAPHGRWVDTPEYGRVWIPNDAARADWQPYTDGRWVWTSYGWSFASSVPWGWAAFHYGRWGFGGGLGWYWVPSYVWGPAWVSWRHAGGHYCWAPYGPRGYVYGGGYPGWVVVPRARFRQPIATVRIVGPQARGIVRGAVRMQALPHAGGTHRNPGLRASPVQHPAMVRSHAAPAVRSHTAGPAAGVRSHPAGPAAGVRSHPVASPPSVHRGGGHGHKR